MGPIWSRCTPAARCPAYAVGFGGRTIRHNTDFADLLVEGDFEVIQPTTPEINDNDDLDCERLAFYPNHHYGRLRELIDVLNEF